MNLLLCWAMVVVTCGLEAQTPTAKPPSESELEAISARGRALAEYDAAAWHATDAVLALKPAEGDFEGFIGRRTDAGWTVMFGRFNQAKTLYLITYEAQQGSTPTEFKATRHEPPQENSDFYLRAAKAEDLVGPEFIRDIKPERRYNLAILPTSGGEWYVYALPAQTDFSVLPYGGDIRYKISADGTSIIEKRQMHQAVNEDHLSEKPQFAFHTHVLSDTPEDSDVFYALTRKASQGEWIATGKFIYEINPDSALHYLGETDKIAKSLEQGKFEKAPGPFRPMMLASLRRLLAGQGPASPLEAFTTLNGTRCHEKTIWLKFSYVLRNTTDTTIILYSNPLQNSGARFAATKADILAGKFESLLFFAMENIDLTPDSSFMALGPGMTYEREQEYPIKGLDLKGKAAVQFLFFTWPLGHEKETDTQRARWAKLGTLYTEKVASEPAELVIDPKVLKSCGQK
jgi:hypothetical protein